VNQTQLFFESVYDALGADIAASGGFKVVAGKLWPSEGTAAVTKLRNCLNIDQPHKLSPCEVLQIKRLAYEVGSTATVQYEAQQLGYVCTWVSAEDELERIERENNELLKAIAKRQERAELLRSRTPLKVIR
jgi:hypothetical protein